MRRGGRRRGAARHTAAARAVTVLLLAATLVAAGALSASAVGGAATVETEPASGVGRTGAVLHASVNPNGVAVSECSFEYGSSETSLTSSAPCTYLPGELETPVPVEAPVSGLSESSTWYFRIHTDGAGGPSTGGIRSFTTLPTLPAVNNEPPVAVGRTSATLRALVDPDDSEVTECVLEWGLATNQLDHRAECGPLPGAGAEGAIVSTTLEGLSESTVYYYRFVARNGFGPEHTARSSFETLPARPRAQTSPNSPFGRTTATLRGAVTPNGAAVESCVFEWGSASVEEHSTACEQAEIGSGESPVEVTAKLSGLSESTTYHYRLVATNVHGTDAGTTYGFTTPPYLAKTTIGRPRELTDVSAELKGKVDPQGETVTECRFEYGTTIALGGKAPCASLPGGGEGWVPVTAQVSGLSPQTGYYARLRVVNASGVSYSGLEPFTTFASGLPPVVRRVSPKKGSPAGGTAVTISGEDLGGAESVAFGEAVTTQITADSPFSLTVVSPPGTTGTVDVVVTTAAGESPTGSGDRFSYGAPSVAAVTPEEGPLSGGTPVTITGDGFEQGAGATTFLFGKAQAGEVECASSTSCTAVVPPGAKRGKVKVRAAVAGKPGKPVAAYTYTP